jgi:hypothetical protein
MVDELSKLFNQELKMVDELNKSMTTGTSWQSSQQ